MTAAAVLAMLWFVRARMLRGQGEAPSGAGRTLDGAAYLRDVAPMFRRVGCAASTCHGRAGAAPHMNPEMRDAADAVREVHELSAQAGVVLDRVRGRGHREVLREGTSELETLRAWVEGRSGTTTYRGAGVTVRVPRAFERQEARDPTPELLATWTRQGREGDGPLVLQLVALRAEIPQRALTETELQEFRVSDLVAFTDSRERARALGFDLDAIAGRATANGHALVRLATAVPVTEGGVLVVVMAPAEREREAREVFRDVLASARGETDWQTPRERALWWLQHAAAASALAAMAAYGALALVVFRRRDAWHRARAAALMAMGAAWWLVAALVPWGQWFALIQAVVLGAVLARHGWRIRRRSPPRFSDN